MTCCKYLLHMFVEGSNNFFKEKLSKKINGLNLAQIKIYLFRKSQWVKGSIINMQLPLWSFFPPKRHTQELKLSESNLSLFWKTYVKFLLISYLYIATTIINTCLNWCNECVNLLSLEKKKKKSSFKYFFFFLNTISKISLEIVFNLWRKIASGALRKKCSFLTHANVKKE